MEKRFQLFATHIVSLFSLYPAGISPAAACRCYILLFHCVPLRRVQLPKIIEWFGLEGTFKRHVVQPPCNEQGHPQLNGLIQELIFSVMCSLGGRGRQLDIFLAFLCSRISRLKTLSPFSHVMSPSQTGNPPLDFLQFVSLFYWGASKSKNNISSWCGLTGVKWMQVNISFSLLITP